MLRDEGNCKAIDYNSDLKNIDWSSFNNDLYRQMAPGCNVDAEELYHKEEKLSGYLLQNTVRTCWRPGTVRSHGL